MTVTPGKRLVEAFGFAAERRSTGGVGGALNFSLAPSWSVTQFTGADIDQLIPTIPRPDAQVDVHQLSRARCDAAPPWLDGPPVAGGAEKQMPVRIGRPFAASDAEWKVLGAELERWFGPKGSISTWLGLPARSQVPRPKVAPEVASATFHEYTLPNARSMPHSLTVDGAGRVWISGWDAATNAVLKFDPATEQFRSYPVPTANAVPHTPCATRDGRVWMALNARGVAKIAMVDPGTDRLVEINWSAKMPGTHNCQEDRDGNIWFSSLGESDEGFYVYNPRTEFRSYKYQLPATYPAGSKALLDHAEGIPRRPSARGCTTRRSIQRARLGRRLFHGHDRERRSEDG